MLAPASQRLRITFERLTNSLLRRQRRPDTKSSPDAVREHPTSKERLVLPFVLGHGQEAVSPFIPPARQGSRAAASYSRTLRLSNLPALHRSEPTGDMAKEPEFGQ